MLEITGKKIDISRGDTGQFTITFTGEDKPADGTNVWFSLKKTKNSENVLFEKHYTVHEDKILVRLTSNDTDLPFGQYWWDVRIRFPDGSIYTPMLPASFRILEVIGDAG